jgi:GT2 family glycosyltransferase
MGELAVIINSYNRIGLLKDALSSVTEALRRCEKTGEVFVFEAGSEDGSLQYLREKQATSDVPLRIIEPGPQEDTSFAAGVNRAIKEAENRLSNLKWCLLYETDNYIQRPEALREALDLIENRPELGALGFTVERHNGRKAGYGERFPTVSSFVLGQQISAVLNLLEPQPEWQEEAGHRFSYSDVVYTSPLLVSHECWTEVGGMDQEVFPFTGSDVDLCWRISKSGKKCGVLDTEGVIHDNRQIQSEWSANRVLRFHESRWKLLSRHRGMNEVAVRSGLFLRHVLEIFGLLVLFLVGRRPAKKISSRLKLLNRLVDGYSRRSSKIE